MYLSIHLGLFCFHTANTNQTCMFKTNSVVCLGVWSVLCNITARLTNLRFRACVEEVTSLKCNTDIPSLERVLLSCNDDKKHN